MTEIVKDKDKESYVRVAAIASMIRSGFSVVDSKSFHKLVRWLVDLC